MLTRNKEVRLAQTHVCQVQALTHTRIHSSYKPYHRVQNRRWFFGRSCTSHRKQAAALYSVHPSLLRHRERSLLLTCSQDGLGRTFWASVLINNLAWTRTHAHALSLSRKLRCKHTQESAEIERPCCVVLLSCQEGTGIVEQAGAEEGWGFYRKNTANARLMTHLRPRIKDPQQETGKLQKTQSGSVFTLGCRKYLDKDAKPLGQTNNKEFWILTFTLLAFGRHPSEQLRV